jgi:four helix bundle protein
MTYERFEDLPVWQHAIRLAEGCEDFLIAAKEEITFSKRDQLDRCSLSVSNNIAEGFERGTKNELLAFLYIARGSAGEVRSMLCYFERRPALVHFKSEISNLKSLAEGCSRQLRAWADSLQNSAIEGQRHLNNRSKEEWRKGEESRKSRDRFDAMTREGMKSFPTNHPLRMEWERKNGPL